jgi:hypothetical protein
LTGKVTTFSRRIVFDIACAYAEAMRYTITDEMPPELHNLIGRKVPHAGIYTEATVAEKTSSFVSRQV